ncbi:retrovirus-related pol polyprotein from transposon TNT 1-94 [Tanacetum coccineum]
MAKIMGYGDYQIGNVMISRVYYVKGLGHNLFFVGQFCDSNLKVAFRQHTCFIRNLEGVDLLTGSRGNNLYTLSLGDMMASSPICLLSKASKTKSWLWHRRFSHLNFGTINHLDRHGLVRVDTPPGGMRYPTVVDKEGKAIDPSHYRGMIGTLLYLTASRPDLQFAICMCAQYQARTTKKHLHAVKRIFWYLRGTVNRGQWYPKDSSIALTAFAEADHAGGRVYTPIAHWCYEFLQDRLLAGSSKRQ